MSRCHAPACREAARFACSRCRAASYCAESCQRAAWPAHKALCAPIAAAAPDAHAFACACCPAPPSGSLQRAAAAGDAGRVRALLARGVAPGELEAGGAFSRPLQLAAYAGGAAAVAALCDAGARLHGTLWKAAAHIEAAGGGAAARARARAVADELLRRGAVPDHADLKFACQADALDLAELFLARGAPVDGGPRGEPSALMCAAEFGSPALIELLLRGGADVRARDARGWTALHFAVTCTEREGDRHEAVRALLRGGARVNAASESGSTPLWIASQVRAGAARGGVWEGARASRLPPPPRTAMRVPRSSSARAARTSTRPRAASRASPWRSCGGTRPQPRCSRASTRARPGCFNVGVAAEGSTTDAERSLRRRDRGHLRVRRVRATPTPQQPASRGPRTPRFNSTRHAAARTGSRAAAR